MSKKDNYGIFDEYKIVIDWRLREDFHNGMTCDVSRSIVAISYWGHSAKGKTAKFDTERLKFINPWSKRKFSHQVRVNRMVIVA